jgi:hypothetical protein
MSAVGQKFNKLTVVSVNKKTSHGFYFNCICECGKEKIVRGSALKSGEVKSCGCSRIKDLTNMKFGTLEVLCREAAPAKNGNAYWKCICKCGKIIVARGSHLLSGNIKSCGICSQIKDISGNIYGKLKVLNINSEYKKNLRWFCECECGNKVSVQANNLTNGHVRSCGCSSITLNKNTCIKKYGVDHPSKDPYIAAKMAKGQLNATTIYHWKTGQQLICVASFEAAVINRLNELRIDYMWQSKIFTMPDGRTYRPDLYLIDFDAWIEIKGYFRKDAEEKWNWFHKAYTNSELWDKKKLKELNIL